MQALVKTMQGVGHLELRQVPVPQPAPDEVLIRVRACGICGSDLKIQEDQHPYVPPVVIGHEFAGEIAKVGREVDGWAAGERVVAEQHTHACGRCRQCLTGNAFACASKRAPGYFVDGGFAEYIAMPAWLLHRIPEGLSFAEAAFSEPAAVAAHGVLDRTGIEPEDVVLVLGCGPIGLAAAKMAQAAGAACTIVTGIDRDEQVRLPRAREMGIDHAVNVMETDLAALVSDLTGWRRRGCRHRAFRCAAGHYPGLPIGPPPGAGGHHRPAAHVIRSQSHIVMPCSGRSRCPSATVPGTRAGNGHCRYSSAGPCSQLIHHPCPAARRVGAWL